MAMLIKYSCFDLTFMFRIDGHFECVLAKLNFRNIDPLTINVVFIDVITADRYAFVVLCVYVCVCMVERFQRMVGRSFM
jgi:hypothetical protein